MTKTICDFCGREVRTPLTADYALTKDAPDEKYAHRPGILMLSWRARVIHATAGCYDMDICKACFDRMAASARPS